MIIIFCFPLPISMITVINNYEPAGGLFPTMAIIDCLLQNHCASQAAGNVLPRTVHPSTHRRHSPHVVPVASLLQFLGRFDGCCLLFIPVMMEELKVPGNLIQQWIIHHFLAPFLDDLPIGNANCSLLCLIAVRTAQWSNSLVSVIQQGQYWHN